MAPSRPSVNLPENNPYIDYQTYIRSDAWQLKREEFFRTAKGKRCAVCATPRELGFHVHHRTYNRLGNERMKDLMLLCPEHHGEIHFLHDRRKQKHGKRGLQGRPSLGTSSNRIVKKHAKRTAKKRAAENAAFKAVLSYVTKKYG